MELERWFHSGRRNMVYDTLIEAPLVHLRLLDEFLGSQAQVQGARLNDHDTVFAASLLAVVDA